MVLTSHPALPDVAEGLDISVADASRLWRNRCVLSGQQRKSCWRRERAEAELEHIRLAEEERKLAEVRRQRR